MWIIDPIDGTSFFSRRDPNWRVHIALAVAGSIEIAVVAAPALRRCWWAVRGGGLYSNAALHRQLLTAIGYRRQP